MKKLLVVWTSDHIKDINNFIMPYSFNSKKQGWFDEVDVLIWGKSQIKVKEDKEVQEKIIKLINEGVNVYACKFCSDDLGVSELLESLGVTVMYTGVFLSDSQKNPDIEVISI